MGKVLHRKLVVLGTFVGTQAVQYHSVVVREEGGANFDVAVL